VLKIGNGYGYFSAILSRLFRKVTAVEASPDALSHAQEIYTKLSLRNIDLQSVDNYLQSADEELFDYIIVEGSLTDTPKLLVKKLKEGGTIIYPHTISPQQSRIVVGKKISGDIAFHDAIEQFYPPLSLPLKKICCHHC
jgi:protein-L-isoaspartate O-methyltransferase